jgi:hypothetical protein
VYSRRNVLINVLNDSEVGFGDKKDYYLLVVLYNRQLSFHVRTNTVDLQEFWT